MADRIIQMKDNQGNNLFPLVKISPSILEENYLPITGGILTGDLILKGDPTSLLMPATKQYVDNKFVTKQYVDETFLKRAGDTTNGQFVFNKTNDHAIQIGTIRGLAVGDRIGEYIHMYNRVHIGSPSGWGTREAPDYGLSVYGAAWLATDTGSVGIGNTAPEYKLDVNGTIRANGGTPGFLCTVPTGTWSYLRLNNGSAVWDIATNTGSHGGALEFRYQGLDTAAYVSTSHQIYGAVWNDYAEYRISNYNEPGRVVMEDKKGILQRATERLQPFAGVVSDTFGFAIGETDEAKTPLAVAGRVLVYPYRPKEEYNPGDCVCAAPDGTVDIMTRQEIRDWPDRIVGTVSEIPDYETWGTGNVEVNGRIWIKVR